MTLQYASLCISGLVDDVMFSYFHIMEPVGQNRPQCYVLSSSPGGGTFVESAASDCVLITRCEVALPFVISYSYTSTHKYPIPKITSI